MKRSSNWDAGFEKIHDCGGVRCLRTLGPDRNRLDALGFSGLDKADTRFLPPQAEIHKLTWLDFAWHVFSAQRFDIGARNRRSPCIADQKMEIAINT